MAAKDAEIVLTPAEEREAFSGGVPGLLAEFISEEQLITELNTTKRTLDRWALQGDGPPRVRIGRRSYYRRDSVLAWLRGKERPSRPPRLGEGRKQRASSSTAVREGR